MTKLVKIMHRYLAISFRVMEITILKLNIKFNRHDVQLFFNHLEHWFSTAITLNVIQKSLIYCNKNSYTKSIFTVKKSTFEDILLNYY